MKVNVITWVEFKLTYYDVAIQQINHYAMGTLLTPIFCS